MKEIRPPDQQQQQQHQASSSRISRTRDSEGESETLGRSIPLSLSIGTHRSDLGNVSSSSCTFQLHPTTSLLRISSLHLCSDTATTTRTTRQKKKKRERTNLTSTIMTPQHSSNKKTTTTITNHIIPTDRHSSNG
eukprot:gene11697-8047_t